MSVHKELKMAREYLAELIENHAPADEIRLAQMEVEECEMNMTYEYIRNGANRERREEVEW